MRICLFLLLGAIVNVAVAWWCSQLPAERWSTDNPEEGDYEWLLDRGFESQAFPNYKRFLAQPYTRLTEPQIVAAAWSFWWMTPLRAFERTGSSWRFVEDGDFYHRGFGMAGVRVRSGWPCQSLEGGWTAFPTTASLTPEHASRDLWKLLDAMRAESSVIGKRKLPGVVRPIPLYPIWPGFAINTVFYACVLWLLFAGPFVVRRWRRIRRGLCPKCAYDLRGTTGEVCPECGEPVTPARA